MVGADQQLGQRLEESLGVYDTRRREGIDGSEDNSEYGQCFACIREVDPISKLDPLFVCR